MTEDILRPSTPSSDPNWRARGYAQDSAEADEPRRRRPWTTDLTPSTTTASIVTPISNRPSSGERSWTEARTIVHGTQSSRLVQPFPDAFRGGQNPRNYNPRFPNPGNWSPFPPSHHRPREGLTGAEMGSRGAREVLSEEDKVGMQVEEVVFMDHLCAICLETLCKVNQLTCGHKFCKFCITEWKRKRLWQVCPICRDPISAVTSKPGFDVEIAELYLTLPERVQERRRAFLTEREQAEQQQMSAESRTLSALGRRYEPWNDFFLLENSWEIYTDLENNNETEAARMGLYLTSSVPYKFPDFAREYRIDGGLVFNRRLENRNNNGTIFTGPAISSAEAVRLMEEGQDYYQSGYAIPLQFAPTLSNTDLTQASPVGATNLAYNYGQLQFSNDGIGSQTGRTSDNWSALPAVGRRNNPQVPESQLELLNQSNYQSAFTYNVAQPPSATPSHVNESELALPVNGFHTNSNSSCRPQPAASQGSRCGVGCGYSYVLQQHIASEPQTASQQWPQLRSEYEPRAHQNQPTAHMTPVQQHLTGRDSRYQPPATFVPRPEPLVEFQRRPEAAIGYGSRFQDLHGCVPLQAQAAASVSRLRSLQLPTYVPQLEEQSVYVPRQQQPVTQFAPYTSDGYAGHPEQRTDYLPRQGQTLGYVSLPYTPIGVRPDITTGQLTRPEESGRHAPRHETQKGRPDIMDGRTTRADQTGLRLPRHEHELGRANVTTGCATRAVQAGRHVTQYEQSGSRVRGQPPPPFGFRLPHPVLLGPQPPRPDPGPRPSFLNELLSTTMSNLRQSGNNALSPYTSQNCPEAVSPMMGYSIPSRTLPSPEQLNLQQRDRAEPMTGSTTPRFTNTLVAPASNFQQNEARDERRQPQFINYDDPNGITGSIRINSSVSNTNYINYNFAIHQDQHNLNHHRLHTPEVDVRPSTEHPNMSVVVVTFNVSH